MTVAQAMWVHAHSMIIEHPDRLASVWRAGFYTRLIGRPAQSVWIHFPVPTPGLVDDRLRIGQAMVRFRTIPTDAWVAAVHIYDGENRIAAYEGERYAPIGWEVRRFFVPGNPEIRLAIGISINVQFHHDTGATAADSWRIDFSSVGCVFLP